MAAVPSEKRFREQAEILGWEVVRGGWPDFMILKDSEIVLVEVKIKRSEGNYIASKLTSTQLRVLRMLEKHGLKVRVCIDGQFASLLPINEYLLQTLSRPEPQLAFDFDPKPKVVPRTVFRPGSKGRPRITNALLEKLLQEVK